MIIQPGYHHGRRPARVLAVYSTRIVGFRTTRSYNPAADGKRVVAVAVRRYRPGV